MAGSSTSAESATPLHYIELSDSPIRFDAVSQLTNVFFDDSNKQIFAVRSGGVTGVVVKGPTEKVVLSFCMNDRGPIRSIKFSANNQVLAVQRSDSAVEFICFANGQPLDEVILHQVKGQIFGFVWVSATECALISNTGVEIYVVLPEKRQLRSVKSLSVGVKWFAWCAASNAALLCTTDNNSLVPIMFRHKAIVKLPKLDLGSGEREVQESKVTLGKVYGTMAVLLLQPNASSGMMEVEVFLLNGPGLAPRKCHVLRLGLVGRFALNTLDNLIVVHHQSSATSMLFDISLSGEQINDITYHSPITPGRSLRPFALKVPSLDPEGKTMPVELYSSHWVLFQPNVVIDAKLGCMWYLRLCVEPLCTLISDRIRLTEFLLQREAGKPILLKVLKQLIVEQYNAALQPVLATIFNKINEIYKIWVDSELSARTAQPSNVKTVPKAVTPKVVIEQSDMYAHVFEQIAERPYAEAVLMIYLQSLNENRLAAQTDLSRMLITETVRNGSFDTLRTLVDKSLLEESKLIIFLLLSYSKVDPIVQHLALVMQNKIRATEITIEVLLEQGKIIEALRLAKNFYDGDKLPSRKFLTAAHHSKDPMTFYTVYKFFQRTIETASKQVRNNEDLTEFIEIFKKLGK